MISSIVREEVDRLKTDLERLKTETNAIVCDFESYKEISITKVAEQNQQISSILCSRLCQKYGGIPFDRVEQIPSDDANLIANIAILDTLDKVLRIIRYKDGGDEFYRVVGHLMKVTEDRIKTVDISPDPTDSSQVLLGKLDSAKGSIEAARAIVRNFKDVVKDEIPNV